MRQILTVILIVIGVAVFSVGCSSTDSSLEISNDHSPQKVENKFTESSNIESQDIEKMNLDTENADDIIIISENDRKRILSETEPVKLQVNGENTHTQVVSEAKSVEFNGDGNIVIVPDGSKIQIIDNGKNNVIYFK